MTDEEIIAVVTAHKEGKTIEVTSKSKLYWEISESPCWNFDLWNYRVKPEPHYRPFKDAEEVMDAIKEHGSWVIRITTGEYSQIQSFTDTNVLATVYKSFDWALGCLKFADGTPFGKLED